MTAGLDFASYPRQRLRLQWQRRDLLTSLITEIRIRHDRNGGGIRLSDLGLYPDELLELLTPAVRNGFTAEGDREYLAVIALMDGRRTIKQVAHELEQLIACDRHHAFQYTRGVFLHLVSTGDCEPR